MEIQIKIQIMMEIQMEIKMEIQIKTKRDHESVAEQNITKW
jgi:hypothetical protein